MITSRTCTICKEIKALEYFAPRKDGVLKRDSRCRKCCGIKKFLKSKYIPIIEIDGEQWNDIPGFNHYQISNFLRVKSVERMVLAKNGASKIVRERIMTTRNAKGYVSITLRKDGCPYTTGLHRLVALAMIPNPEGKPCVNHKEGVKVDNRPESLEWCTYEENERHSIDVLGKRVPFGEKSSSAKLTEQKVLAIRRLYKINPKFCRKTVANKFGMHPNSLNDITRRKSWKHI